MLPREWILSVVKAFYAKATQDFLIGYHFRNIQDFDHHIPRIALFWELQLLGSSEQKPEPGFDVLKAHIPLHIKPGELGRWLILFRQTLEHQPTHTDEMQKLKQEWLNKLSFFEGVFSRFFGFQ